MGLFKMADIPILFGCCCSNIRLATLRKQSHCNITVNRCCVVTISDVVIPPLKKVNFSEIPPTQHKQMSNSIQNESVLMIICGFGIFSCLLGIYRNWIKNVLRCL